MILNCCHNVALSRRCRRRKKSRNKAEQQSEEEVTEEPHHLEHDSPGSSNSKSSSTQQQQSGANLRSAATSLIVTASHLLLYLPALLLLGLQVISIIKLFDNKQVTPALFPIGATIGDGGEPSSGRPLCSHCLFGISNSSYGAPLDVAADASGSTPDPQTAFALLLLILGEQSGNRKEVQQRIPDVCAIMSLSISHSSYKVTFSFSFVKRLLLNGQRCFDIAYNDLISSFSSCVLRFRLNLGACKILWST